MSLFPTVFIVFLVAGWLLLLWPPAARRLAPRHAARPRLAVCAALLAGTALLFRGALVTRNSNDADLDLWLVTLVLVPVAGALTCATAVPEGAARRVLLRVAWGLLLVVGLYVLIVFLPLIVLTALQHDAVTRVARNHWLAAFTILLVAALVYALLWWPATTP